METFVKRFANGRIRLVNEDAMKVPLRQNCWREGTLIALF